MEIQNYFKRYEIKYLLSPEQYEKMREIAKIATVPDEYGKSTVCNIYYDTPDSRIIRRSLEGPEYKEKLRLRSYGVATNETGVFLELKKKYLGVVYKRREAMTYARAVDFLRNPEPYSQITRETEYFMRFYENLMPAMFISYSREAFYGKENRDFRITFDRDILWRDYDTDLRAGVYGKRVISPDTVLMEIKTGGAMPMEIAHALSQNGIYKTSFSKYGRAYIQKTATVETEVIYA